MQSIIILGILVVLAVGNLHAARAILKRGKYVPLLFVNVTAAIVIVITFIERIDHIL